MSFDKPEDLHSRDTTLARLLADALESRPKLDRSVQDSACPDAEVLATYAEHALTEEETARWEGHFADCGRCQKIIAVLSATGEELAEAEIAKLGNLAAASSARKPAALDARSWALIWRPTLWRWLVPAAGLASAAGLWLALRQAPQPGILTSQKIVATAETPQNRPAREPADSSAKPDETQIAQANLPPPPAPSPRSGVLLRDRETPAAKSPAVAPKEEAKKQEPFANAVPVPTVSVPRRALESRADYAKDERLQSAQGADQKSTASNALGAAAPAAPVASPPPLPSAAAVSRAERQSLDRAAGAPAATQLKALTQNVNVSPAIVFASPNRRALWRLGSAGRIERSTDQGQNWQLQSSGVTADLLAGVAPSESAAWVVGGDGTILRTEDGEHWQRVAPPPAGQPAPANPASDWTGVDARDALHATIISRDLHRFATEDGGRTWLQQQ